MERCQNTECLKLSDERMPFPVLNRWGRALKVNLLLCKPCAKERRLMWLRQNRPQFLSTGYTLVKTS